MKVPDLRADKGICNLGAKVMHPRVEFIHLESNRVQSVNSRAHEGEEDRFSWRERLTFLGSK